MSILSAQSIRLLCEERQLLTPFVTEKTIVNGMSYGLSAATYDVRVAEDLLIYAGDFVLASTVERFKMPDHVCAQVLDKSSWARKGIACQNTFIDPGWEGYLTLELTNHTRKTIEIKSGSPICQIKFEWLDMPTDLPYRGKYQNQEQGPQAARDEKSKLPKAGDA